MKTKTITLILVAIALISVFFNIVQKTPVPPGFNSDEASFGYNAYSLLKTGKDEYGTLLPLRLKSFGDYKMPLYSYLSVPFVAIFGLNEWGARSLNTALAFLFPFCVYLLAEELFKNKKVSLLSAFLVAVSLGLHIVSRHAHESYLQALLTTLSVFLTLKALSRPTLKNMAVLAASSLLLLFSYHPGRLFVAAFIFFAFVYGLREKKKTFVIPLILVIVIGLFSITDIIYKPARLQSLAFFTNQGFTLTIEELKREGGMKFLYNPLTVGIREIVQDHLTYYSPQFLIQNGDENYRFGYPGMGIMTPLEYLFIFVGLYFLFKNKERWRWFILFLVLVSPLSASLSWSKGSLTRSLFLLVPLLTVSAYGMYYGAHALRKNWRTVGTGLAALAFIFFLVMEWDFYLLHYPKRLITIHAWQGGYKQVNEFIRDNYSKYDAFYITRDIGMPYIFTLFYLQYPPQKYQQQARLSAPDEYGFGQVDRFDKFVFAFKTPNPGLGKAAYIGSVDNFKSLPAIDKAKLQTVTVNGEPMFQIYAP